MVTTLIEMNALHREKPIIKSIQEIDDIIKYLDKRWMESEKIISFLQKWYDIGNIIDFVF